MLTLYSENNPFFLSTLDNTMYCKENKQKFGFEKERERDKKERRWHIPSVRVKMSHELFRMD